jgi:tetratricopeptide (TPR) repeat protein
MRIHATLKSLRQAQLIAIATLSFLGIICNACSPSWSRQAVSLSLPAVPALPSVQLISLPPRLAAKPLPSDEKSIEQAIQFLSDRVQRNANDYGAQNRLAAYSLQRFRETDNTEYLKTATRAAQASLAVIPAERNTGALTILTQTEMAVHNFDQARNYALQLTKLDASKSEPYGILGDALLELGDYEKATDAFRRMQQLSGTHIESETRLARLAWLKGDLYRSQRHLFNALALALNLPVPPRETVAWCRWQLGELAFAVGNYQVAEQHYRDALTTFPGYLNAIEALGHVRAARGDLPGAIQHYETVVRQRPDDLAHIAALGDLYQLAGRSKDASTQYQRVEQIGRNGLNKSLHNRELALFYADHDLKVQDAYAIAKEEYAVRRDIYGADVLAWTALKAGKLAEAKTAIRDALRLGTLDARLFYHAGMIAEAKGDRDLARSYLSQALTLNPQFDLLQSQLARKILENDR